jgi:2-polyprenyl-6-hydroxyphenyl methylase / 3-demethylubiquinone-9 3-methyltransferase
MNVDPVELAKFADIANRWWDVESEFKPLHRINPLRTEYINAQCSGLAGKRVLDVGCGGGILSEAMAAKGAIVTGIDLGDKALSVARLHLLESGLKVDYQLVSAEAFAETHAAQFDVVTCLEMLEHVPDPAAIIKACAHLVKPGGRVVFSTLSRNLKSYVMAVLGAEYLLGLLPKGTHDYEKLIKPAELASHCRAAGLTVTDLCGMHYNPLTSTASWTPDTAVNYIMSCQR